MKLAIIGASSGQLPLCLKAKEMGVETICFAWDDGAICKEYVNRFYPISVLEKDRILEICRTEKVDGVVSNASDLLAEVVSFVSDGLQTNGNHYDDIVAIREKGYVREVSNEIDEFEPVPFYHYENENLPIFLPCVIKPETGASKKGVSFVKDKNDYNGAINYALEISLDILIEKYIDGREISVETLSYGGKHYIIQITDKDSSGPPHFVELGHHQPANLNIKVRHKIESAVYKLLDKVHYENGAAHVEMKIDNDDNLYLIELNPRGGGDYISAELVELSTGFDYVRAMIEVALGVYVHSDVHSIKCAGVYFLCNQNRSFLPLFKEKDDSQPWLVRKEINSFDLCESTSNYDRNGYLIYSWDNRVDKSYGECRDK